MKEHVPFAAPVALAQAALNRLIGMDPEAPVALAPLDGASLAVKLEGTGVELVVGVHGAALTLEPADDQSVDATIAGTPLALLRMALEARSGAMVSGTDVSFSGNVEVVQKLKTALARLDIDWEEQLSAYVGDVGSRTVTRAFGAFESWTQQLGRTVAANANEYLEQEAGLVPNAEQVEQFASDVDRLRDDVERLTLRVQRLAGQRLGATKC